jgi:hypothetical protein
MATNPDLKQFTVEKIFPAEKLVQFKTSPLVKSLDPTDFADLEKAFSIPPIKTGNAKLAKLTTQDLVSIGGLFEDYRVAIVANFHGIDETPLLHKIATGDTCCCCCTPCCCCSCAAAQTEPFVQ